MFIIGPKFDLTIFRFFFNERICSELAGIYYSHRANSIPPRLKNKQTYTHKNRGSFRWSWVHSPWWRRWICLSPDICHQVSILWYRPIKMSIRTYPGLVQLKDIIDHNWFKPGVRWAWLIWLCCVCWSRNELE